jgi:hypothetical protein
VELKRTVSYNGLMAKILKFSNCAAPVVLVGVPADGGWMAVIGKIPSSDHAALAGDPPLPARSVDRFLSTRQHVIVRQKSQSLSNCSNPYTKSPFCETMRQSCIDVQV